MVIGLAFNKASVYIGFATIDREKAKFIARLVHQLGYEVNAVEHNATTQRQYERKVRSLEEADVAIAIVSPESLNSAHMWREVATCNALSKPMIPVVVEPFEGVMPLTDVFDATLGENMELYYREALERRLRKARGMKSRYEEKAATQLMKELDQRQKRATRLNAKVTSSIKRANKSRVNTLRLGLAFSTLVVTALALVAQFVL